MPTANLTGTQAYSSALSSQRLGANATSFRVGYTYFSGHRAWLQFDATAIPSHATISGANLQLTSNGTFNAAGAGDTTIALCRVSDTDADLLRANWRTRDGYAGWSGIAGAQETAPPQVVAQTLYVATAASKSHSVTIYGSAIGIIIVVADKTPTMSLPEGWTRLLRQTSGTACVLEVWYQASPARGGVAITLDASLFACAVGYSIDGYLPPVALASNSASGTSATPTLPVVDAPWLDENMSLALHAYGWDYNRLLMTQGGLIADSYLAGVCPSTSGVGILAENNAGRFRAVQGAPSSVAPTISASDEWASAVILLKGAAATGTPLETKTHAASSEVEEWDSEPVRAYVEECVRSQSPVTFLLRALYEGHEDDSSFAWANYHGVAHETLFPVLEVTYAVPDPIEGTVMNGATPVEGATIRAITQATGDVYVGATDEYGVYSIDVPAGSYHVIVEYEDGMERFNAPSQWDVEVS